MPRSMTQSDFYLSTNTNYKRQLITLKGVGTRKEKIMKTKLARYTFTTVYEDVTWLLVLDERKFGQCDKKE